MSEHYQSYPTFEEQSEDYRAGAKAYSVGKQSIQRLDHPTQIRDLLR